VAEEPVPGQELALLPLLHDRISRAVAELRVRARRPRSDPRAPGELMKAAEEALRALRAEPALAAGIGVALLVVAGVAAALAVRGRRL